jgi:ferredoxin-like protein FixX
MALLLRASRCPFLPGQKHEYKSNGHDRRRYHDRLECARIDVYAGKLHKRQWEYGEEPESHNDSYDVVVSPQEGREPKPIYLSPVAGNAFSSVAGHICWNSARRTYSAFTKVAFFLSKPRTANGAALLLLLLVSHCPTICYHEIRNNITVSYVKQNLNLLILTVGKGSKNSYTSTDLYRICCQADARRRYCF